MNFRIATTEDIPQITDVRFAVKENVLNDISLVTKEGTEEYLNIRGKGWVCEIEDRIAGFAIADLWDNNIWALFVHPDFEKMGIGKKLHDMMIDWYFSQTDKTVWLSTDANTRAEQFYRKAGWKETGKYNKTEIKFEMSADDWNKNKIAGK